MLAQRLTARIALVASLAVAGPLGAFANEPPKPDFPVVIASTPIGESVAAMPPATEAIMELDPTAASGRISATRPQAPLTAAPASRESSQWLVVLIQTALAEKGCSKLSINGEWDNQTRLSVASVLGAAGPSASDLSPSNATLSALRTTSVGGCGLPGRSETRASLTAPAAPRKAIAKEKKARAAAVAAVESQPRVKPVAAARAPTKPRQAAPSAPVVARAQATFVRPIGVGAF